MVDKNHAGRTGLILGTIVEEEYERLKKREVFFRISGTDPPLYEKPAGINGGLKINEFGLYIPE